MLSENATSFLQTRNIFFRKILFFVITIFDIYVYLGAAICWNKVRSSRRCTMTIITLLLVTRIIETGAYTGGRDLLVDGRLRIWILIIIFAV